MRELKNFESAFASQWAGELKQLFKNTIDYQRTMKQSDYTESNIKIKEFEQSLTNLLTKEIKDRHQKERAFVKRLVKNIDSIFTFLYFEYVPSDNNGSERAIRNVKVKMKIFRQETKLSNIFYHNLLKI